MFLGMGPMELIVILIVVLVIFGPKNLPKLGKSLGQTVKNVREGMEGDDEEPAKAIADKADGAVAEAPEVVEDASEVVEEDVQFCSKCGAKNAADAGFCNKCGAKLG